MLKSKKQQSCAVFSIENHSLHTAPPETQQRRMKIHISSKTFSLVHSQSIHKRFITKNELPDLNEDLVNNSATEFYYGYVHCSTDLFWNTVSKQDWSTRALEICVGEALQLISPPLNRAHGYILYICSLGIVRPLMPIHCRKTLVKWVWQPQHSQPFPHVKETNKPVVPTLCDQSYRSAQKPLFKIAKIAAELLKTLWINAFFMQNWQSFTSGVQRQFFYFPSYSPYMLM